MRRALMTIAVFLFALSVSAGERLPEGILAHASTPSLATALANLDALAVACVKDTPTAQRYTPGTLPVLVGIFSPLPNGAWDQNGEIHALAVMAGPKNPQPVLILKTPGLEAFKKAMADGGVKLQGDGQKMSAQFPKLGTWYLADIGGDRVAGAMNEAARDFAAQAVAGGWSPEHAGGADLSVNLDLKNLLAEYKPAYDAGVEQFKRQFEDLDDKIEHTPEAAKPLVAALSRVALDLIDKLDEEVPAMDNLGLDLFFGDERAKLALSLSGDEGSGLDALRAAYAVKGQPKYALANSLPEETSMAMGVSDMSVLPEGLVDFYVDSLREIADAVIPDRADEFAELPREFLKLGIGECMAGSYIAHDQPVTVFAFDCAKPKEFQALVPKAVELGQEYMTNLLKMSGEEQAPSVTIEYEAEASKVGDIPYRKIAFNITRPNSDETLAYDTLFAVGRKTVTGVHGRVTEEDLAYAIANFQSSSGGFIDSDPVKATLSDIDNRQVKYLEVRPIVALLGLFIGQADLAGIDVEAMKTAARELSPSPACLALGVGATDRLLTWECVIPAEVVNNIILNAKAIGDMGAVLNPSGTDDSDADEPEVYFDDPQPRRMGEANAERFFDDPAE